MKWGIVRYLQGRVSVRVATRVENSLAGWSFVIIIVGGRDKQADTFAALCSLGLPTYMTAQLFKLHH